MTIIPCPRCRVGFDQGDGECDMCWELSENDLREMMYKGMQQGPYKRNLPHYPTDAEEAGKPRARWARLLVVEGSELQVAWHKANSYFKQDGKLGNVSCTVLNDAELTLFSCNPAEEPEEPADA